jgi:hypothetical protein
MQAARFEMLVSSSIIALHVPPTYSFKSIEGYAGEISLHQFTCHFNLLHFLGEVPGELEQDDRIPTVGPSSPHFHAP